MGCVQEKLLMKGRGEDLFTCGATSLYGNIDLVSCLEAVVRERIYAASKMSGTTFSSWLPCVSWLLYLWILIIVIDVETWLLNI